MKKLVWLLLLISVKLAFGIEKDMFIKYGLGVPTSPYHKLADMKLMSVGQKEHLRLFTTKWELGYYADNRRYLTGLKNSGFLSAQIGVEPRWDYFYVSMLSGVGLITNPDSILGSGFQFFHDFAVGVKDDRNVGVGFYYKHISNAGIKMPNYGRDFFGIEFFIPIK